MNYSKNMRMKKIINKDINNKMGKKNIITIIMIQKHIIMIIIKLNKANI